MEKIATVIEYGGKPYFAIKKKEGTLLVEHLRGSFLNGGLLGTDECLGYEIQRKGSILISGDVFNSDYFRTVVFHVGYSELSSYGRFVDMPPSEFCAWHFNLEDELCLAKQVPEGALYDAVMARTKSNNSLQSIIDGCTERFLEKCKRTGIHVTLSVPPRPVLFTDYPGNIRIVNCYAL